MTPERISALGRIPFIRAPAPLLRERRSGAEVFGLDTEYTPEGRLVCWTVAHETRRELFTSPLTIGALRAVAEDWIPGVREATFVSYFSLAELQFFDLVAEAVSLRIYGRGSVDAKFGLVSIIDVARFFDGQSLAAAAKSFGLEKLEYDVTEVSDSHLRIEKFREYAKRDAWLAREIFMRLRAEFLSFGRGVDCLLYPTAASVAATHWRRDFLKQKLSPPASRHQRLILRCAMGGRAEAFRRGVFPVAHEFDLKSAYPRAVISFGHFYDGAAFRDARDMEEILEHEESFAEVDFVFPRSILFPCLPIMHESRMLFPTSGRSCATGDELRAARNFGARLSLVRGSYCINSKNGRRSGADSSAQDFMSWALTERAKQKDSARGIALKLLANSLTGKWIQNRDGLDYDALLAMSKREGCRPEAFLRLGPCEREELGIASAPRLGGAFWPTAYALTTGRVRARLAVALNAARNPLYCATDSVWTDAPENFGEEWDEKIRGRAIVCRTRLARIHSPEKEHLAYHGIGRRDDARELLEKFAARPDRDHARSYETRRPIGLKEGIRKDLIIGRFVEESGRFARTNWDDKRKLLPDGSSAPWETIREFDDFRADQGKRK